MNARAQTFDRPALVDPLDRLAGELRRFFVLTADLVGYSELMFRDPKAGLACLVETRGLFTRAIVQHQGRVVSTPGDFVLAVFERPGNSVAAAVEAQRRLNERNRKLDGRPPASWRVGIAYGEVFEIGNDVYGHAVNIAARIQSFGRPGDVLISEQVKEHIGTSLGFATETIGERRLKNIAAPVTVHRLRWPGLEEAVALEHETVISGELLLRLAKPTLRIEPFEVLERSERKARLARAIEDDIHIVLSRLSGFLSVRDRESPAGGPPADYVLKGSLQGAGRHLRLMARLVSLATGATIWAERYDCDLGASFDVQDEIAREIVVALQLALTEGEQARFWRRGTKSGLAWEHFQVGRDQEGRYSREGHRRAKQQYEEALRLDPTYLSALVALGFCHVDEVRLGWCEDDAEALAQAEAAFKRAAELDSSHPDALALLAFIRVMQGREAEAREAMKQGVAKAGLNSELVGYQGALYDLLGDFPAAIRAYGRALSLSSHAKPWIGANLGLTHLAVGQPAEAEKIYRNVIESYPDYARAWIGLAVALLRRDRPQEARQAALRVMDLDPRFTVSEWGRSRPFSDQELLDAIMADMREAGLPG